MNIVEVSLDEQPVDPKFGVPEDYTSFLVTTDKTDDVWRQVRVRNDPADPNYQEVHEWYKAQKKKPFDFKFKNPPKK